MTLIAKSLFEAKLARSPLMCREKFKWQVSELTIPFQLNHILAVQCFLSCRA